MTAFTPTSNELLTSIVDLRVLIETTRDDRVRASLREIEIRLRHMVGPSVTKKPAAALLGISVTALDRWIDNGYLTAVRTAPDAGRLGVETAPLLELATRVARLRGAGQSSGVIARAIRELGWHSLGTRYVIDVDLARLPRPNVSVAELRHDYMTTTPEQRFDALVALHDSLRSLTGSARASVSDCRSVADELAEALDVESADLHSRRLIPPGRRA